MIASGLSLKRTGLLLASVLVAALILALFEPLIDTGWRPASWDVPHLIGNVYLFSLVGAVQALVFGLPLLALRNGHGQWNRAGLTVCGAIAAAGPWALFFLLGISPEMSAADYARLGWIVGVPLLAGLVAGSTFHFLLATFDRGAP